MYKILFIVSHLNSDLIGLPLNQNVSMSFLTGLSAGSGMTYVFIPKTPRYTVVISKIEMKQISYNGAYLNVSVQDSQQWDFQFVHIVRPNYTGFNNGDVCECVITFQYQLKTT